jgi:hypothetical protein
MSSAFDCNKRNTFTNKSPVKTETAAEPVKLVVNPIQIIQAGIPFNTAKASAIRNHMHANILFNGQRIFIFRQGNGWTNISLNSTASDPALTCAPAEALKIAYTSFKSCPDVSDVTIEMVNGTTVNSSDIDSIVWEDMPRADTSGSSSGSAPSMTDGETIIMEVRAVSTALSAFVTQTTEKLDTLVAALPAAKKPRA